MESWKKALKSRLLEIGSKLGNPPTSVNELLSLLERVQLCLSLVEQSPPREFMNALSPTLKALVSDQLFRHADVDVKVAVASCLTEITRITAPEVPYDDQMMKEVFQLIVSSFESLDDKSSKSYSKRTSILEHFARFRLCVVMLDLELHELILQMFRHFIKAIRDYQHVFADMETIMISIIEESEEISSDLLFCIFNAVRKDNKEVMPAARKLMEKVIETCADKLGPYIEIELRKKGVSLADYKDLVNRLCVQISAETVLESERTCVSAVEVEEESDQETPDVAIGKRQKIKEVDGGTSSSRKRPPPSSKSKSASNKHGRKSIDKSKARAKANSDGSKEEAKMESVKKLGRRELSLDLCCSWGS